MGSSQPRNWTQSIGCTPVQNRMFKVWKKQTKEWGSILGRSVHESQKEVAPGGPVADSTLPVQGAWVWSLVRELRFHCPSQCDPSQTEKVVPHCSGLETERGRDQVWGLSQRAWYDVSFRLQLYNLVAPSFSDTSMHWYPPLKASCFLDSEFKLWSPE